MAHVKHTKTELKAQMDALKRFEHFLPMLQLKKQQLRVELNAVNHALEEVRKEERKLREAADEWIGLLGGSDIVPEQLTTLEAIRTHEGNIAGVLLPVFEEVRVSQVEQDLFATDPWVDDAQALLEKLLVQRAKKQVLKKQQALLRSELHTTNQRVNLFEKVKIPECRENIRVIRIYLGDEQAAAVARGKLAKKRGERRREAA